MHRPTVGIISLVLLTSGVAIWLRPLDWEGNDALRGALMRLGIVMAAMWLALPQLHRLPGWIISAVGVAAIVIAVRPRTAIFLLPLLLAYLALRPRRAKTPRSPPPTKQASTSGKRAE